MYFLSFFILTVIGVKAQDCGKSFSIVGADAALAAIGKEGPTIDTCYTLIDDVVDEDPLTDRLTYLAPGPDFNPEVISAVNENIRAWILFDGKVPLISGFSDPTDINNLENEDNIWLVINEEFELTGETNLIGVSATCGCMLTSTTTTSTTTTSIESCIEDHMADGECDGVNNNFECNYDEGDCCECTCVDGDFECGIGGFECLDPSADCDSDDDFSSDDDYSESSESSDSESSDDSGGISMNFSIITVVCVLFSMIALV